LIGISKEPKEDEVSKYEKAKKKALRHGVISIFGSVKWIFFFILGVAYLVAYGRLVPEEDIVMASIVTSGTLAVILIFGYIWIDTKWDQRRRRKDQAKIVALEKKVDKSEVEHSQWKESFFFNFQQTTTTMQGTINTLKENSEKSIFLMSKPKVLLTETNMLFEEEFGWTYEEINYILDPVALENRPEALVKLLVRHNRDDNPDDVEDLISSRVFNGNRTRGRLNDIWLCRKDKSDFSADLIIQPVDDFIAVGFIKNIEEEKSRQARDEATYQILLEFKNHIEGKQNSKTTRKAMTKHLDNIRSIRDGK
jgi:hypothetical protein